MEVVRNRLSNPMSDVLDEDFTEEEVVVATKGLKSHAAPGLDGMPEFFYQHFWSIEVRDVTNFALNILNGDMDLGSVNHTHICLIPKEKKPVAVGDFQPISLCNVVYEIISKTIAID